MRSADLAGPSISILLITVQVIPAPITPPSNTYFGSTFASDAMESLPVINHAATQTANAVSCTHPFDPHIPVVLVTCVLNTPCPLISAPDNKAISNLVKLDKKYSKRGLSLKKEAADAVMKLMDAATKENLKLDIISAYRTHDYQNTLFTNSTKKNGINYALKYSAKKYHSEHELGLAVDFNTTQEKFKKTKEYAWLKDNAYKYGFIERYKKGKEYITGYGYEPWHYRYVGTTAALKIYIEDITLEEYKIKYE